MSRPLPLYPSLTSTIFPGLLSDQFVTQSNPSAGKQTATLQRSLSQRIARVPWRDLFIVRLSGRSYQRRQLSHIERVRKQRRWISKFPFERNGRIGYAGIGVFIHIGRYDKQLFGWTSFHASIPQLIDTGPIQSANHGCWLENHFNIYRNIIIYYYIFASTIHLLGRSHFSIIIIDSNNNNYYSH